MRHVGVLGPQRLLADGEAALEERLGLGVAALVLVQPGQVVERGAHVGVVGPQRLLADGEAALVERLGLGVAALGPVQPGQVVERLCHVGVVRPQRLLADGEAALVQRLGLGVAALRPVQHGQVVEQGADVGVLGAQRLLADGEQPFGDFGRLDVLARLIEPVQLGIECGGIIALLRVGGARQYHPAHQPHRQDSHQAPRHPQTSSSAIASLNSGYSALRCDGSGVWRRVSCKHERRVTRQELGAYGSSGPSK